MTDSIDNALENTTPNNFWMADLYVSRRKAYLANAEANHLEVFGGDFGAHSALNLAKKVENEFMARPDFEKIRTTDKGYQKLLEEFAMDVGSDLLDRDMNPDRTPIGYAAHEQSRREQAEKFTQKANKIASEHNSPREKIDYVVFTMRCYIREFVRDIKAPKSKNSIGVTQLFREMEDLDKQKGQYMVTFGDVILNENISRLDALSKRLVFNVSPIAPTPPFLTPDPPDNINATFRSPL
jgi:hypothetical protein